MASKILHELKNELDELKSRYKLPNIELVESPKKKKGKVAFYALLVLGAIGAICEGFDGITSILGLIPGIPILAVFLIGLIFALLSVLVFYGVGRTQIATNLGYPLKDQNEILDVSIKILDLYIAKNSKNEAIIQKLQDLLEDCKKSMENKKLKIVKATLSVITAILFFSGGFFAGQSVPLLIGKLLGYSLTISSPVVIAVSILVGIAASICYWYFEKPGLEIVVENLFKVSREKIGFFETKLKCVSEINSQKEHSQQEVGALA